MEITGVSLTRIGDDAIVEVEIHGQWFEVIRERYDGAFGHIVNESGIRTAGGSRLKWLERVRQLKRDKVSAGDRRDSDWLDRIDKELAELGVET